MNAQSHLSASSKCFLSFLPQQPRELKAGGATERHPGVLIKEAWEGMITAKPAVETNIIGARLNFISLQTAFCHQRNQSTKFKVTLIWDIPHKELSHAFKIIIPCWVFFLSITSETNSCQVDLWVHSGSL